MKNWSAERSDPAEDRTGDEPDGLGSPLPLASQAALRAAGAAVYDNTGMLIMASASEQPPVRRDGTAAVAKPDALGRSGKESCGQGQATRCW